MKLVTARISALIFFMLSVIGVVLVVSPSAPYAQVTLDAPNGKALIDSLRNGGLVIFLRHADTAGMPCDSLYRIGQREGQRNLSQDGQEQARRIGQILAELNIPLQEPILTGPVFRARDTAELAFGAERVDITDSLIADDYAGTYGVSWVISEHQRLFATPPSSGLIQILVGHRTPALISLGGRVSRTEFPEGAAILMRPVNGEIVVLGVLSIVPSPNPGVDRC